MNDDKVKPQMTSAKDTKSAGRVARKKPAVGKIKDTPSESRQKLKTVDLAEEMPLFQGIKETRETYGVDQEGAKPTATKYLVQVEKGNLLTYLAFGLIYPVNMEDRSIVRTQTRARDPQFLCPDALILSPGFFKEAETDQVLIEVTLSPEEKKLLITFGEVALLPAALPVSRIVSIWTLDEKTKNGLLASARTFSDAPLLPRLVKQAPEVLIDACVLPVLRQVVVPPVSPELMTQKLRYNRMLGMLAFMRNADKYYSAKLRRYRDVSSGYIATIVRANKAIKTQALTDDERKAGEFFFGLLVGKPTDKFFEPVLDVIYKGQSFNQATLERIVAEQKKSLSFAAADAVRRAFTELFDDGFKQCQQVLEKSKGLWHYTILSILHRFQKRESNDKVNVKNIFPDVIGDPKMAEIVLALLGQYYGYAAIPKEENIGTIDRNLFPLVGEMHAIKYTAGTQFDRLIIETVFHVASTGEAAFSLFDYLPRDELDGSLPLVALSDGRIDDASYNILGTQLRVFNVVDEVEKLIRLIYDTYNKGRKPVYLGLFAMRNVPWAVRGLYIEHEMRLSIDIGIDDLTASLGKMSPTEIAEARLCVEADRCHVYQSDSQ